MSALRRRLAAEDDSIVDTAKEKWDADLTAAVKRFQYRLGLKQTGVVAGATLRELDVPAETRFHQLEVHRTTAHRVRFRLWPALHRRQHSVDGGRCGGR